MGIGVIFDCDGTLLDSMEGWIGVETDLALCAGRELTPEERTMLAGRTTPETAQFFHEVLGVGESVQAVIDYIDAQVLAFYETEAVPKPGALAFVQGLAEAGIPMAVASSTPHTCLDAGLAHCGFLPYMSAVLSPEDVDKPKRWPDIYLRAAELLGLEPHEVWVFEDALYAVKSAKSGGFRVVGIYDTDVAGRMEALSREADLVIHGFEDLTAEQFLAFARNAL